MSNTNNINMNEVKKIIEKIGWARLIIGLFLLSLYIVAPRAGVDIRTSFSDTIIRFGMNAILVLSLVPMIRSGTGLNFGMPLGIVAGLLGAVISLEIGFSGFIGFFMAILISIPFGVIFGWGYGNILNKVKGGEMMIATYVGFSSVAFMCIMWLILPFKSPNMIWAYGGSGLRTTISIEEYWHKIFNKILGLGDTTIPVGEILFFALVAAIVALFFKTKSGIAMKVVGQNNDYAKATGIDIDKVRIQSVIMSTVLAGIGIVIYQQSFGFIQLYLAPFNMAFPAIAAILIGGASMKKVSVSNVIIGTFLFQGILTMTPNVISGLIETDMSETIRIIVSNGMILYALTRREG